MAIITTIFKQSSTPLAYKDELLGASVFSFHLRERSTKTLLMARLLGNSYHMATAKLAPMYSRPLPYRLNATDCFGSILLVKPISLHVS